jgi:hypothetical protein
MTDLMTKFHREVSHGRGKESLGWLCGMYMVSPWTKHESTFRVNRDRTTMLHPKVSGIRYYVVAFQFGVGGCFDFLVAEIFNCPHLTSLGAF